MPPCHRPAPAAHRAQVATCRRAGGAGRRTWSARSSVGGRDGGRCCLLPRQPRREGVGASARATTPAAWSRWTSVGRRLRAPSRRRCTHRASAGSAAGPNSWIAPFTPSRRPSSATVGICGAVACARDWSPPGRGHAPLPQQRQHRRERAEQHAQRPASRSGIASAGCGSGDRDLDRWADEAGKRERQPAEARRDVEARQEVARRAQEFADRRRLQRRAAATRDSRWRASVDRATSAGRRACAPAAAA